MLFLALLILVIFLLDTVAWWLDAGSFACLVLALRVLAREQVFADAEAGISFEDLLRFELSLDLIGVFLLHFFVGLPALPFEELAEALNVYLDVHNVVIVVVAQIFVVEIWLVGLHRALCRAADSVADLSSPCCRLFPLLLLL